MEDWNRCHKIRSKKDLFLVQKWPNLKRDSRSDVVNNITSCQAASQTVFHLFPLGETTLCHVRPTTFIFLCVCVLFVLFFLFFFKFFVVAAEERSHYITFSDHLFFGFFKRATMVLKSLIPVLLILTFSRSSETNGNLLQEHALLVVMSTSAALVLSIKVEHVSISRILSARDQEDKLICEIFAFFDTTINRFLEDLQQTNGGSAHERINTYLFSFASIQLIWFG